MLMQLTCMEKIPGSNSSLGLAIVIEVLWGFLQALQTNVGIGHDYFLTCQSYTLQKYTFLKQTCWRSSWTLETGLNLGFSNNVLTNNLSLMITTFLVVELEASALLILKSTTGCGVSSIPLLLPQPISQIFILILSFHLLLGLPIVHFLRCIPSNFLAHPCYMPCPSESPLFHWPNNTKTHTTHKAAAHYAIL
jgi:hypothetical protein